MESGSLQVAAGGKSPPHPPVRFAEAFRFWLKLGFISFGGPTGQIAIMHQELVERRRWISNGRFLHALNYCMLLPGPEAQQLAIYVGWLLHRVKGGIVAGVAFVLPAFFLILGLSYAYVTYGDVEWVSSIFYGLRSAVITKVGDEHMGRFVANFLNVDTDEAHRIQKASTLAASANKVYFVTFTPSYGDGDIYLYRWNGTTWALVDAALDGLTDFAKPYGAKGVAFAGEVLDTGVCHMAFCSDPDGNTLSYTYNGSGQITQVSSASGGAMVPLLTLGIPGSNTTAVIFSALIIWGMRPGPLLIQENPEFVWGLIASMYIGNVVLLILNIPLIPLFVQILRLPNYVLFPGILGLSFVGVYSVSNSLFHVWTMGLFGLLGYAMKKLDFPTAPLVLGMVLGYRWELALRQSLMLSGGSIGILFTRPISAAILLTAVGLLCIPLFRWIRSWQLRALNRQIQQGGDQWS